MLFFVIYIMQLHMLYATKNVTCNYFLVTCDMYNFMKQVAKDNFPINDSCYMTIVDARW